MVALIIETGIWFSVVMLVAICRFTSRIMAVGSLRKLQSDDLVMVFALCTYITLVVTINHVAHASTNLLPPGFDVGTLTPQDIKEREYGSKLTLVVEQCQIATVWAAKACILIMYSRLTIGRMENIAIKILAAYVAFGFVFMEIFYFGVWCRPFKAYFEVPTPSEQCNAAINHLITNAVFNLSSDAILLIIALPMFIRSRFPLRKKIALVSVFGLGLFVILCAILNKYYSFTQPFGSLWTFWYVRESSTALLVTNLPYIWTVLRRVFKFKALDSTISEGTYGSTPLSRMRSAVPFTNNQRRTQVEQGLDPETGRQFSENRQPSVSMTPFSKEEAGLYFLTTPSQTDSWGHSWTSKYSDVSPRTPSRCITKDALLPPRSPSF
ncbi:hypothetical protein AAFC00_002058 [Neodothiora populina]|uniref:Rhodopsin domain-containing protein n=1 Tax=Neodothiora populina TaxID=2781224 RepID=A0ABR3PG51_9PEZI